MAQTSNVFEDAVCWINGRSLAGHVREIELPTVTWMTVEHEALGMFGTPEYPVRLEPLECTITWADFYETLAIAAANPFTDVKLQVRGNIAEYGATGKLGDRLMTVDMTGRFLENSLGGLSPGEPGEYESVLKVTYVKQQYNGSEILELDVNIPIYRVAGQDQLANFRRNLGI